MGARRNLSENIYNASFLQALEDIAEEQDLADGDILDQYMDSPTVQVSENCQQNMKLLLQQAQKRKRMHKHPAARRRTALAIAAAVIVVVALPLTAQASIFDLFDWIFNHNNVYTSMDAIDKMESETIVTVLGSTGWDYFYFPQNLPQGYALQKTAANRKTCRLIFARVDSVIEFRQTPLVKNQNPIEFSDTYMVDEILYNCKSYSILKENAYGGDCKCLQIKFMINPK